MKSSYLCQYIKESDGLNMWYAIQKTLKSRSRLESEHELIVSRSRHVLKHKFKLPQCHVQQICTSSRGELSQLFNSITPNELKGIGKRCAKKGTCPKQA